LKYKNVLERFYDYIEKTNSCWNWTGPDRPNGYGRFCVLYKTYSAHRFSYLLFKGQIPEGLSIDHLCRNRKCVNPDHLELVTTKENLFRSDETRASINKNKQQCLRGHPYDSQNTYIHNNKRYCKICVRENVRKYQNKKKELPLKSKVQIPT